MSLSTGHLGQTSDKPAVVVIVTEIGRIYLPKGGDGQKEETIKMTMVIVTSHFESL